MREKLTKPAERLLCFIIKYHKREINLRAYSYLMQSSRRWTRKLMSELRQKGYVRVEPENMKIHKSKTCRYILLDENGNDIKL